MKKITAKQIMKVKDETGAPIMRVKKVLVEQKGNEKKTIDILKKEGFEKMEKRQERETGQGLIETYVHHSGKVASVVELLCETDFVARNDLFKALAHDLALQLASMEAKTVKTFEKQDFIKDPSKKIADLVKEVTVKTGENIRIGKLFRMELGK